MAKKLTKYFLLVDFLARRVLVELRDAIRDDLPVERIPAHPFPRFVVPKVQFVRSLRCATRSAARGVDDRIRVVWRSGDHFSVWTRQKSEIK